MTAKRDLKRRVRERAARTGESYMAARAHVVGEQADSKPSVIEVEEMIDVAAEAEQLGFKCRVVTTSTLARRVDWRAVLERLRDALVATDGDPTTDALRAVALRGERPLVPKRTLDQWRGDLSRFLKRARAGIGGTSDIGNMIALHVDGATIVAYTWLAPIFRSTEPPRTPSLTLTLLEELGSWGGAALYARK